VSAEKAGMAAAQFAPLIRGLRNLGMFLDTLIIIAAMVVSVHIAWHTPFLAMLRFWRNPALGDVSTWKLLAVFFGFAIVLLWNSSRRNDCTLRKRTPLQEQKLNLQD